MDLAGNVLEGYSMQFGFNIGPMRAFRNNLKVFPTQFIKKADNSKNTNRAEVAD